MSDTGSSIAVAWDARAKRRIADEKLAAFGLAVLKASRQDGACDIDGGSLQEMAVAAGALEKTMVTEPCCESCVCAEAGGLPGECYFIAAEIRPLINQE